MSSYVNILAGVAAVVVFSLAHYLITSNCLDDYPLERVKFVKKMRARNRVIPFMLKDKKTVPSNAVPTNVSFKK